MRPPARSSVSSFNRFNSINLFNLRLSANPLATRRRFDLRGVGAPAPEVTAEVTPEVARLLRACGEPLAQQETTPALRLQSLTINYQLSTIKQFEMTVPDRPTSRLQKYRVTAKGRSWSNEKHEKKKKK